VLADDLGAEPAEKTQALRLDPLRSGVPG